MYNKIILLWKIKASGVHHRLLQVLFPSTRSCFTETRRVRTFSPRLLSWEGEWFQFGKILWWFVGLGGHGCLGKKKICCVWAELSAAGQERSKCESSKMLSPGGERLDWRRHSFHLPWEFPWESFWWLSRDAYFNSVWTLGIIRDMPLVAWWGFSCAGTA